MKYGRMVATQIRRYTILPQGFQSQIYFMLFFFFLISIISMEVFPLERWLKQEGANKYLAYLSRK